MISNILLYPFKLLHSFKMSVHLNLIFKLICIFNSTLGLIFSMTQMASFYNMQLFSSLCNS